MDLLIGTEDGLFVASGSGSPSEVEPDRTVNRLLVDRDRDRAYATTPDGLLRSRDAGRSWSRVDLSRGDLFAVGKTPRGRLIVGTHDPADLYVSDDGGDSWEKNRSFADLPGHDEWDNLAAGSRGRVRDAVVHPTAPDRWIVSVEAEGVFVSPDGGDSWERRIDGLNHDVHDVVARTKDEWYAATGRGCYRTSNAGRTWQAIDTRRDLFWHTYYRAVLLHEGRLYTSGQDRSRQRFENDGGGVVVRSDDGGRTVAIEEFPGSDDDYVNAWTARDGRPVGGTVGGRLVERRDGEWREVGATPTTVRALATVEETSRR